MSWEKEHRVEKLIHFPGRQEVEKYIYTPGLHGLEFAKKLKEEGRILAGRCPDGLQVPPKTFCPDGTREAELVDVTDEEWVLVNYTIVTADLYGNKLEEPQIVGVVKPVNAERGMIHIIKAEDPSKLYPGMKVKPVIKPPEQRTGQITDIAYFEPAE